MGQVAAATVRALAGLVFVAAAAGQLRRWPRFTEAVAEYRLLPDYLVPTASYLLPIAELTIGASLLVGLRVRLPDLAAVALLLAFGLAMGVNMLRGRADIDCGCFHGERRQPLRWVLVIRNVVLAAALVVAALAADATSIPGFRVDGLLAGAALFIVLRHYRLL